MANLQRDNVGTFGFGRTPSSIGSEDLSYPLYDMFPPPLDPNDPLIDPNIK